MNRPGTEFSRVIEIAGIGHDVRKITNYLACSTETRSELVILIRSGDRIHAQIDIDSHQVAAFDDDAVAAVQRVADWLARRYQARAAGDGR